MGKHKDADTLSFIEWLRRKGESLGFVTESEYPLHKNEYFVDVVWKLRKDQDPLITFELETKDGSGVFSNTAKIFGTTSTLVSKPWRHFIIIYKSKLSKGHRNSLQNIINLHNICLFENVFGKPKVKRKLEKALESLTYDISELIETQIRVKSIGQSLPPILKGLTMGLDRGLMKDPEISISIRSSAPLKGGIKFSAMTETPSGEPTFLDKLEKAKRTLKPFAIETPQLKDLIIDGKSVFPKDMAKAKLVVTPTPSFLPVRIIVVGTKVAFDNILLRRVKTKGKVDYISTEKRNLPFVFNFNLDRKQKSGSFSFRFEPLHADVKQALQFEEFIRDLNIHKELRIVEPKENKVILGFLLRRSLKQPSDWHNLVSKLAYIQEKTKHTIPAPTTMTKKDIEDIYAIIRVINTGEDRGTINEISIKVNKQGARNLIETAKKQGKIPNLELYQPSTYCKLFKENISLGPSRLKLPDMQLAHSVEEVEKLVKDASEKDFITLSLKPMVNNKITIRFENWP